MRSRSALYRVLSGRTTDPRTGTLLELCGALAIGPDELLQLAGLYQGEGYQLELIDVELQQAIGEMAQLDEGDLRLCLALLWAVLDQRSPGAGAQAPRPRRRIARPRAET